MQFLTDDMLGRLCKWLRIMGFDTVELPGGSDEELFKKARAENRVLLTRDKELAQKATPKHSLFIKREDYLEQLKEVVQRLHLKVDHKQYFSRCLGCNEPVEEVAKKMIQEEISASVFRDQDRFWRCKHCHKIFWKGSHYTNTLEKLCEFSN